jgi:hypothetical protein
MYIALIEVLQLHRVLSRDIQRAASVLYLLPEGCIVPDAV